MSMKWFNKAENTTHITLCTTTFRLYFSQFPLMLDRIQTHKHKVSKTELFNDLLTQSLSSYSLQSFAQITVLENFSAIALCVAFIK